MGQAHPRRQIVRHREDISQRVNLKLIKSLVDGSLEQSLQCMQSILNLLFLSLLCLLVAIVLDLLAILQTNVCRRWDRATDSGGFLGIRGTADEAEIAGRDREQTGFDGVNGAIDDSIDRIDDFVNERLSEGVFWSVRFGFSRDD